MWVLGKKLERCTLLRFKMYLNFSTGSWIGSTCNMVIWFARPGVWWLSWNHSVLQSLYESIKTEPFKIPEDDGNDLMHTFFNPDKEGWLWKQGEFHPLQVLRLIFMKLQLHSSSWASPCWEEDSVPGCGDQTGTGAVLATVSSPLLINMSSPSTGCVSEMKPPA
jgi:hypothetical protein